MSESRVFCTVCHKDDGNCVYCGSMVHSERFYFVPIINAFSINMLPVDGKHTTISFYGPLNVDEINAYISKNRIRLESGIGHQDTASVISEHLGVSLEANRINIKLGVGDHLIVAQYSGPRLPEGAVKLPEDANLCYWVALVLSLE